MQSAAVKNFKQTIEKALTAVKILSADLLIDKLMLAYRIKTLQALHDIFLDKYTETLTIRLKDFLGENWSFINGTMLCYTALPDDDSTTLLCDIAQWVANDLQASSQSKDEPEYSALTVLMPTVEIDSLSDDDKIAGYPSLHKMDVKSVLKTHIIGSEGLYLIPVKQLTTLLGATQKEQANHYYNHLKHSEDKVYITIEEIERLINHSYEAAVLAETYKNFEILTNDQSNLLTQLNQLYLALRFNDAHYGVGQQESAGKGAYGAIVAFNDYYQKLGDDNSKQIPEVVKTVIDELLMYSSDPDENQNTGNHSNINTCIGILGEDLRAAVVANRDNLANIGISDRTRKRMVEEALQCFSQSADHLKTVIESKKYIGRDKLGLTKELLTAMKITLSISSVQSWVDFLTLNPDDISELCRDNEYLKQQIIERIDTPDNFFMFAIETQPAKFRVILEIIGPQLARKFQNSLHVILGPFMSLDEERYQIFMQHILTKLIKTADDFGRVLSYINEAQIVAFCQSMKDAQPELIKTAGDFESVLKYLNEGLTFAFCQAMKEELRALIESADDFRQVLQYLNKAQQSAVYEAMKEELPRLIVTASDFCDVLLFLNKMQKSAVYEAMKEELPRLIKTAKDFANVLLLINETQSGAFCQAMEKKLPKLIITIRDFCHVFFYLTETRSRAFIQAIKKKLPKLIKSADDFKYVLKSIHKVHHNVIYEVIKNDLIKLIKTAGDFEQVLRHLNEELCGAVYETMKGKLPKLIYTADDFEHILCHLNEAQRRVCVQAMTMKLPKLIESADAFNYAFSCLNEAQRTSVFEVMKEGLPKFVNTAGDFRDVLQFLNEIQRYTFCQAMNKILPKLIISADEDFIDYLKVLNKDYDGVFSKLLDVHLYQSNSAAINLDGDYVEKTRATHYSDRETFPDSLFVLKVAPQHKIPETRGSLRFFSSRQEGDESIIGTPNLKRRRHS